MNNLVSMNDEENYLPWANYKPFYELSKEDFDKIGTNSCFRVRCKLCAPALKTIGTNKTSSSNLRKHLKCVHPLELEKLETFGTGRKKREGHIEPEMKYRKLIKMEDFQVKFLFTEVERDLLCQLVNEYHEIVDCKPTDPESLAKKRKAWESLTIAFNEAGLGLKRTTDQLRNFWETIKAIKKERTDDGHGGMPCNISAVYSTNKPDIVVPQITFPTQDMWDNTMADSEGHADSETDIHQPIVITSLRNNESYSNLEMDCGDQSPMQYNGIQQERQPSSRMEQVKSSLLEEKLNEERINEQRVRTNNLRVEQVLRKEMLKDEMEHKRKMMTVEISHRKFLNLMEKTMKEEEWAMKKEAFLAEERRREERHKIEMSILQRTRAEMLLLQGKKVDTSLLLDREKELSVLQGKKPDFSPLEGRQENSLLQQRKNLEKPPVQSRQLETLLLQGKNGESSVSQNNQKGSTSLQGEQEGSPLSHDKEEVSPLLQD